MNRVDTTPTSAPKAGGKLGAGRADAAGHRYAWNPAPQDEQRNLHHPDEKAPTEVGIRF